MRNLEPTPFPDPLLSLPCTCLQGERTGPHGQDVRALVASFLENGADGNAPGASPWVNRSGPRPIAGTGIQALVVPGGGLAWAGLAAGRAVARVTPASFVRRVVVLATGFSDDPTFRVVAGSALESPLGPIPIDGAAAALLTGYPEFAEAGAGALAASNAAAPVLLAQKQFPQARMVVALLPLQCDAAAARRAGKLLANVLDEQTILVATAPAGPGLRGLAAEPVGESASAAPLLLEALAARRAEMLQALSGVCGMGPLTALLAAVGDGPPPVRLDPPDASSSPAALSGACALLPGRYPVVPSLAHEDRLALGRIASNAVQAAVLGEERSPEADLSPRLRQPGGAFVTLTEDGELRGCMGRLQADSVAAAVHNAGRMAARSDPRFAGIAPAELSRLRVEISVLSPFFPISDPDEFEPGRHGLLLTRGFNRGLLLPQVATKYQMDRRQFLDALAEKAGLLFPGAWAGAQLERFGVDAFTPDGQPSEE